MTTQHSATAATAHASEGEKVAEIQTLTARIAELQVSVHWWNSAVIWGMVIAAIAATALVVAQTIAFRRAKDLAATQDAVSSLKEAALAIELKAKDLAIEQTRTKASEASAAAERERLERVKIQEKLAPRRLSPGQRASLAEKLRPFTGQRAALYVSAGDPETDAIASDIAAALGPSGAAWRITPVSGLSFGGSVSGIRITVAKDTDATTDAAAMAAVMALKAERVVVEGPLREHRTTRSDDNSHLGAPLVITVGRKP